MILGAHFFSDTFKSYQKYFLFITLIIIVFGLVKIRPIKEPHIKVTAIITVPKNSFPSTYIPAISNISNLHFAAIPGTSNYKLTFIALKPNAYRNRILAKLNEHIQFLIAENAKRIDKLADALLLLQEKFESLDSVKNLPGQQAALKRFTSLTPLPVNLKYLRVLDYLSIYLTKPFNSFTLIPEGLYATDKNIESQIDDFNKLQYRRQVLLSTETPDRRAITENNGKLLAVKNQLAATFALQKDKLLRTSLIKRPTAPHIDTNSVNKIKRQLSQTDTQITVLKKLINASEDQNRALSKPIFYTFYNELREQKKPLNLWYVFAGLVLLIFPFILSARKILISQNQRLITVKNITKNNRSPALVIPDNNSLRDEAVKDFNKSLIAALDHLEKKSLNVRVILITDNGYKNSILFCLQFAAGLTAANKRVLLVDYNIEHPQLLETLGIPYTHGLRTCLNSEKPAEPGIITTSAMYHNISFIGAGPVVNSDSKDVLSFLNFLENNWAVEETDLDAGDLLDKKLIELIAYYNYSFNYILVLIPHLGLITRDSELYKNADMKIYLTKNEKNEIITTEF